jgi:hypothetical protein
MRRRSASGPPPPVEAGPVEDGEPAAIDPDRPRNGKLVDYLA